MAFEGMRAPKVLRLVGLVMSAAGAVFVGYMLWSNGGWSAAVAIGPEVIGGCVALSALGNLLQGLAWLRTLNGSLSPPTDVGLVRVHARSVLAKYLPGNVFQFVSRHVDLAGSRFGQKQIAAATLSEIVSLVIAALAFVAFALAMDGLGGPLTSLGLDPSTLNVTIAYALLPSWIVTVGLLVRYGVVSAGSFMLYLGYFALFELAGQWLYASMLPGEPRPTTGVLSAAWLAGYLVVGSPGGLGVREAAIVFLLGSRAAVDQLAVFAVVFRLISMIGDAVYVACARASGR
jgi:hypothetical protein